MNWIFKGIVAAATAIACMAQGTVTFNNRTSTGDAKVAFWDGTGLGMWGGMAQLYLQTGQSLTALSPSTPFRNSSAAASYFIVPVDITVPGVPAGSPATFVMRAWVGGSSYETASWRGEGAPVSVAALGGVPPGGGAPITTPDLAGLQGFAFFPEPSTVTLGIAGGTLLLLAAHRKRTIA